MGGTVNVGALFTSLTITVKLLVSLSGGLPLSVTRTVMTLVLGPCASVGVQVRTPVAESSVIPPGPATRANVKMFAGISGSVAVLVQVRTPVAESRVIPLGAATKENVSVLAGISGSVAVLVTVKVVNSLIV